MMLWIVYLLGISATLSAAAFALERAVRPRGLAIRWIWTGALVASLVLPLALSSQMRQSRTFTAASPAPRIEMLQTQHIMMSFISAASVTHLRNGYTSARWNSLLQVMWLMSSILTASALIGGAWYATRRRRYWKRRSISETDVLVAKDAGPATVGLLRSQIVLPEWLLAAAPEALRLVIAHERSHVEARDNALLALGLGLAVLTPWNVFIWWQLRRLRVAIEVDCDRRVLRGGHDARRYARTLVDVSTRRPVCFAGPAVSLGSVTSVERRLRIMNTPKVKGWRASTLAFTVLSVGIAATSILIVPPAAPLATAGIRSDARPVGPRQYVGNYKMNSISVMRVRLRNGHLIAVSPGTPPQTLTKTSAGQYRLGQYNAYIRFAANSAGRVTGLVFHQNGAVTEAPRIGAAGIDAVKKLVPARVRSGVQTPGSKLALRRLIVGVQSGKPDYAELSPQLAAGTRTLLSHLQSTLKPLGALHSIEFRRVDSRGWDHYIVHFQHGTASVGIALDSYGVVVGAGINDVRRTE